MHYRNILIWIAGQQMHTRKICLSYIIYYSLVFLYWLTDIACLIDELNIVHIRALKDI
jgi:hypothetical protein